ncbi:Hypothetical protein CINCED_3A020331 [Cinara cedri]|uniref:Uncharacterized protein n=1 Tax=Cinara cedri TaxID=506608 RepID=A0A5E4ND17_9HEMI|nr:Hypothetical protein CINCED_3A020331 [Cinara cedri]
MSADPSNTIKFLHGVGGVADVVGYPTKLWYATKKYSINGTISTAAINTWVQFSLAYIAAVMITRNDLSFLTNILDPNAISLYALVSLGLVAAFLISVTLKYIHKQEIKDEKFINKDIRGGQSDEINHLAQDVRSIETISDVSHITDKKISIIVPIGEKQGVILENQAAENRNKVIFITIPYVISSLIVTVALGKFGLANIRGWEEISFISMVVAIAVIGAFVALNKLRNNKIDHELNAVVKFRSPNIIPFFNAFVPFLKSKVVLVMENKVESSKDSDTISRGLRVFEKFLTNFTKNTCGVLDKNLNAAIASLETKLLISSNLTIQETLEQLGGMREKIKIDLDELCEDALVICKHVKELTGKIGLSEVEKIKNDISSTMDAVKKKVEEFQPSRLVGYFQQNKQIADSPSEFLNVMGKLKNENEDLQKQLKKAKEDIQKYKQEMQKKHRDSDYSSHSGSEDVDHAASPVQRRVKKLRKEKEDLRLENECLKLEKDVLHEQKQNKTLKKEREKEEITWREALNGYPKEFLYYTLKSIKLKMEASEEVSLRDLYNKVVIHWKNGSQTTCYINKQGEFVAPDTDINDIAPRIQATYASVERQD